MHPTLKEVLATNLRRERHSLAISQDELADRCGLHRTYIGGIERAERNVTLSSVERIASALGMPAVELLRSHSKEQRDSTR